MWSSFFNKSVFCSLGYNSHRWKPAALRLGSFYHLVIHSYTLWINLVVTAHHLRRHWVKIGSKYNWLDIVKFSNWLRWLSLICLPSLLDSRLYIKSFAKITLLNLKSLSIFWGILCYFTRSFFSIDHFIRFSIILKTPYEEPTLSLSIF